MTSYNVMVFYLWSPAGLVERRALCLKGAQPKQPVVTPSRSEEPGVGGGGQKLLAEDQLILNQPQGHLMYFSGMQRVSKTRRFLSPKDFVQKT